MKKSQESNKKTCIKCGETKPINCFNIDKRRKDGRHPYCTPCKTAPYKKPGRWKRYREIILTRKEKPCSECKKIKPLDRFGKASTGVDKRTSKCLACTSKSRAKSYNPKIQHDVYEKNRTKILERDQNKRDEGKARVIALLGGCCAHCGLTPGEEWPLAIFDCHHKDPKEKKISLGKILRNPELFEEEIKKCILLCSNCHRRYHWRLKRNLVSLLR